jgi:hypothetical protein
MTSKLAETLKGKHRSEHKLPLPIHTSAVSVVDDYTNEYDLAVILDYTPSSDTCGAS